VTKYTVLLDEFDEREIRPSDLYERYAALVADEMTALRKQDGAWAAVGCPACGAGAGEPAFTKYAFTYRECPACGTLYVSPRPTAAALAAFRETSAAERFWREQVIGVTAESRSRYVAAPRLDWILDNAEALSGPRDYLHLGPLYDPIPEELARRRSFDRVVATGAPGTVGVETLPDATPERVAGVRGRFGMAALLEVLEGAFAPGVVLTAVRERLGVGGRLLITAVSWDGFETQMLRERARGIGLPSHLNLFSRKGIAAVLAQSGFEMIELSTPGRLDAKLVHEAYRVDPTLPLPRFLAHVVAHEEPDVLHRFQEFLQMARLSSHLRVVAEAS
jgi:hypothetical protein